MNLMSLCNCRYSFLAADVVNINFYTATCMFVTLYTTVLLYRTYNNTVIYKVTNIQQPYEYPYSFIM